MTARVTCRGWHAKYRPKDPGFALPEFPSINALFAIGLALFAIFLYTRERIPLGTSSFVIIHFRQDVVIFGAGAMVIAGQG